MVLTVDAKESAHRVSHIRQPMGNADSSMLCCIAWKDLWCMRTLRQETGASLSFLKTVSDYRKSSQILEKPTTAKSPLAMAGRPALHASTMTVMSSMITNAKPAIDRYSSCTQQSQ